MKVQGFHIDPHRCLKLLASSDVLCPAMPVHVARFRTKPPRICTQSEGGELGDPLMPVLHLLRQHAALNMQHALVNLTCADPVAAKLAVPTSKRPSYFRSTHQTPKQILAMPPEHARENTCWTCTKLLPPVALQAGTSAAQTLQNRDWTHLDPAIRILGAEGTPTCQEPHEEPTQASLTGSHTLQVSIRSCCLDAFGISRAWTLRPVPSTCWPHQRPREGRRSHHARAMLSKTHHQNLMQWQQERWVDRHSFRVE